MTRSNWRECSIPAKSREWNISWLQCSMQFSRFVSNKINSIRSYFWKYYWKYKWLIFRHSPASIPRTESAVRITREYTASLISRSSLWRTVWNIQSSKYGNGLNIRTTHPHVDQDTNRNIFQEKTLENTVRQNIFWFIWSESARKNDPRIHDPDKNVISFEHAQDYSWNVTMTRTS